jgi:hypothetical protein
MKSTLNNNFFYSQRIGIKNTIKLGYDELYETRQWLFVITERVKKPFRAGSISSAVFEQLI